MSIIRIRIIHKHRVISFMYHVTRQEYCYHHFKRLIYSSLTVEEYKNRPLLQQFDLGTLWDSLAAGKQSSTRTNSVFSMSPCRIIWSKKSRLTLSTQGKKRKIISSLKVEVESFCQFQRVRKYISSEDKYYCKFVRKDQTGSHTQSLNNFITNG